MIKLQTGDIWLTYEWHTDDIRVDPNDIYMIHEYVEWHTDGIRVTYRWHTDTDESFTDDTSDIRSHTSDIQMPKKKKKKKKLKKNV